MIREVRNEMAAMFSLMERMEKHSTREQAERNKQYYLFEDGKLWKPAYDVSVGEDKSSKGLNLQILIKGLTPTTKKVIERANLPIQCTGFFMMKGDTAFSVTVMKELNKNKAASQKRHFNDFSDEDIDLDSIFESNDNNNPNINIDFDFGVDLDDDSDSVQGDESNPEYYMDNDVYQWLQNEYMDFINTIEKSDNCYDPNAIANLKDIDTIFSIYKSKKTTPEETRILHDKTTSDVITELKNAISSGNYAALSAAITPLNIESTIWGNQLSSRNARAILQQALNYGFTPTMVHAPGQWKNKYGRKLKVGARPFSFTAVNGTIAGNKNSGSKGHYDALGSYGGSIPRLAYDISDTELIDPNGEDVYETLPGLQNNITGQLNQAAIDYMAQIKSQIPEDLLKQAEECNSLKGKAKIYNEIIISLYSFVQGLQEIGEDIDDENTCVNIFMQNVVKISEGITAKYNYSNPAQSDPIRNAYLFGISYYCGFGEVCMKYMKGNSNLRTAVTDKADDIAGVLCDLYVRIKVQISNLFHPLRQEINKILSANNQSLSDDDEEFTTDSENAQTQQPLEESVKRRIRMNRIDRINMLLNRL